MQSTHTFSAQPRAKDPTARDGKRTRKMKRGYENSNMKKELNETKQEIKFNLINQRQINTLKVRDIEKSRDNNNIVYDNIDISTKRMDTSHDTNLNSLNSASTINNKKGKILTKNNKPKQQATYSASSLKNPIIQDLDKNSVSATHKKNQPHDEEIFMDDQKQDNLSNSDKIYRANSLNCYNRSMHSSDYKSTSKENVEEKSNTDQKNSKNKFKGNFVCGQGTIQGFLSNKKNQITRNSGENFYDKSSNEITNSVKTQDKVSDKVKNQKQLRGKDYKSVDKNDDKKLNEYNLDVQVGKHLRKDSGSKSFKVKDIMQRKGSDFNSKKKKTMILNLNREIESQDTTKPLNDNIDQKSANKSQSNLDMNKKASISHQKLNILEIGQSSSYKYSRPTYKNILKHPKIPTSNKTATNFNKKSDSVERDSHNRDMRILKKDETYSELSRNFAEFEKASYDQQIQNKKDFFGMDKPLEKKSKNKEKPYKTIECDNIKSNSHSDLPKDNLKPKVPTKKNQYKFSLDIQSQKTDKTLEKKPKKYSFLTEKNSQTNSIHDPLDYDQNYEPPDTLRNITYYDKSIVNFNTKDNPKLQKIVSNSSENPSKQNIEMNQKILVCKKDQELNSLRLDNELNENLAQNKLKNLERKSITSHPKNSADDLEYKKTFLKTDKVSGFYSPSNKCKVTNQDRLYKSQDFDQLVKGKPVGAGSFGEVYMMLNRKNGKILAMKEIVIPENSPGNADLLSKSFENEVNLLSKLNHKNIIDYYKCNRSKNLLEIFMEYLPGGSQTSITKEFGIQKKSQIIKYTKDIVEALIYLHSKGFAHRDIKCSNILSDIDGSVKLADFGSGVNLSLRGFTLGNSLNLIESNLCESLKGSLSWMAPEMLLGEKYGRRIDVWSLGCTVYEMATGKQPWSKQKNLNELIMEQEEKKTQDFSDENIDEDIKSFISYCCNYDRNRRPSSLMLIEHPLQKGIN